MHGCFLRDGFNLLKTLTYHFGVRMSQESMSLGHLPPCIRTTRLDNQLIQL